LWFHWRDIKNPNSGGAEVVSHEISQRLVKKGYQITHFCSSFPNGMTNEIIDGVKVIRAGGKFSVYLKAKKFYKENKKNYDLIIDEINTKPFHTPTFVEQPIIAFIHQLAREYWFYETKFPLNYIGYYFLEKYWLSKYRKIPTITVSKSTYDDLKELKFEKVRIIPEGISCLPLTELPEKESKLTVIFVARLKKTKLPDHAINSFFIIKNKFKDAQMWVVGDGPMRSKLQKLASKDNSIKFWGRISNEKKLKLMQKAHLLLVPAIREGWGLVVNEANAMGTPAVAYNVHGLKDSIKNNVNGVLTKNNSIDSLANEAIKLLLDRTCLKKMSENSLIHSKQFSWELSADAFEDCINHYIKNS